jgi:homocysteine S-methyltransferase
MKMAEPDRGVEEGIVIAQEFIDIALDAGAPGIYIIPQFGKYEIAAELVRYIRAKKTLQRSQRSQRKKEESAI